MLPILRAVFTRLQGLKTWGVIGRNLAVVWAQICNPLLTMNQLNVISFRVLFALTIFVSVLNFNTARAAESEVQSERDEVFQDGFLRWRWLQSDCLNCEIYLLPLEEEVRTELVRQFISALMYSKSEILELYRGQIRGDEYNLLAHIAVGILGKESDFYNSPRYQLKEMFPWAIRLGKVLRSYLWNSSRYLSPNSRGPTQIKIVPKKIADRYQVVPENLFEPRRAALATMGYLIEALNELKNRKVKNGLDFVTPETYVDYLPYLYFGGTQVLIRGEATPETNIYVRQMKEYMSWVEVYERESQPSTLR